MCNFILYKKNHEVYVLLNRLTVTSSKISKYVTLHQPRLKPDQEQF